MCPLSSNLPTPICPVLSFYPDISAPPTRLGNIAEVDLGMAPPVMKSFKEFLLSLDDSVDETEAVKRYNDYKLDFRRQQMQDFFLAHKDEEWYVPPPLESRSPCRSEKWCVSFHTIVRNSTSWSPTSIRNGFFLILVQE